MLTRTGANVADRRWPAWVAALAAVAVAWFAIQARNPPSPMLASKVTNKFAAPNAQKHVEAIARPASNGLRGISSGAQNDHQTT